LNFRENTSGQTRLDHQLIFDLLETDSLILDLGCGSGDLLKKLQTKNIKGQGVEIQPDLVKQCLSKGLNVLQANLDHGFRAYQDQSFDYVILNKTLQATHNPLLVLKEALRVGRQALVSFPNFGHYIVRSQLFFGGIMPKSQDLPYEWYDTPNIHLVTIKDFGRFCQQNNFKVKKAIFYNENRVLPAFWPNLFSPYALFQLIHA
jgi:methionine biosynthesis protein MetW